MQNELSYAYNIAIMKTQNVKLEINKLIRKLGSEEATADRLDITVRWVKYLREGREASSALAKIIQMELIK